MALVLPINPYFAFNLPVITLKMIKKKRAKRIIIYRKLPLALTITIMKTIIAQVLHIKFKNIGWTFPCKKGAINII